MWRRLAQGSAWLCLGLLVTACAILQAQDFQQAVDRLSQVEVVARWGLPLAVVAGAEGETLWIDTVRAHVRAHPGGLVVTHLGRWCPGARAAPYTSSASTGGRCCAAGPLASAEEGGSRYQVVTGGASGEAGFVATIAKSARITVDRASRCCDQRWEASCLR